MNYPLRVRMGLAVATALSMWGVVAYFGFETAYQRQSRDPYQISAQAARLEGVTALVPEDAVLGYVGDLDLENFSGRVMFNSAQYTLAPRILRQDTAAPRVLGNFARPGDFAEFGRRHGLGIERDFHNGIVLFRRESAK